MLTWEVRICAISTKFEKNFQKAKPKEVGVLVSEQSESQNEMCNESKAVDGFRQAECSSSLDRIV
jgi:hypothetical protein